MYLAVQWNAQPGRWSASFASMLDQGQNILPATICCNESLIRMGDCFAPLAMTYVMQNCGRPPNENRCCCSCCSGGCCCGSRHARCLHCCSTSRPADLVTSAQMIRHQTGGKSQTCLIHAPSKLPTSFSCRMACSYCRTVSRLVSREKRSQTRSCSNWISA